MTIKEKKELVKSLMSPLTEKGVEKLSEILLLEFLKTKNEKDVTKLFTKVLFD